MNQVKRMLSLLLTMSMLMSLFPVSVLAAGTRSLSLTEEEAQIRNPGDTFVVDVALNGNDEGTMGFGMYFDFDDNVLSFVSVVAGEAATTSFTEASTFPGPGFSDVVFAATANTNNGTIAKATFQVKEGAASGTTAIKLIVDEFLDADDEDVASEFGETAVNVTIAGAAQPLTTRDSVWSPRASRCCVP